MDRNRTKIWCQINTLLLEGTCFFHLWSNYVWVQINTKNMHLSCIFDDSFYRSSDQIIASFQVQTQLKDKILLRYVWKADKYEMVITEKLL